MAGAPTHNNQFDQQPYLSPNQQDLLLAALSSNNPYGLQQDFKQQSNNLSHDKQSFMNAMDPNFFTSPQQVTPSNFGSFDLDDSPFVGDFLDGDNSFDFDATENGDLMIGSLPGAPGAESTSADGVTENDMTEKRKSPTDDTEDPDGGGKRREPDDKTAKKPGRKPLTSEPTTKRKAQNRAAQRAFRERKEKHLKDLEVKVQELEKASDEANQENGILRAQVQRLQTELREYRKRLSLNSTGISRSPPVSGGFSSYMNTNGLGSNNFQFEFPRFGGLPGSHFLDKTNGVSTHAKSNSVPGALARQDSTGRVSPKNAATATNSPDKSANVGQKPNGHGSFNGFFSSPTLNGINTGSPLDYGFSGRLNNQQKGRGSTDSSSGQSRVFQFQGGSSASATDSPSASSVSQYGQNSSCGTSPEPSHNSPSNGKLNDNHNDTISEGYVCHGNSEGEVTFCEKLNMACGNPRNPVPRAMSQSNATPTPAAVATIAKSPATDNTNNNATTNGIDFLANQNGGQFDPLLFGDYRESQAAIVGDGDFTNGFFNDAFGYPDFSSPFNFGDTNTPAVSKPNPMEEIERQQEGFGDDDEVVPGEDTTQMLNCHKIWDKLASRPDFKDGTIDIDGLCSELRAKARCSESGVVVDNKDVEAALKRLPAAGDLQRS